MDNLVLQQHCVCVHMHMHVHVHVGECTGGGGGVMSAKLAIMSIDIIIFLLLQSHTVLCSD